MYSTIKSFSVTIKPKIEHSNTAAETTNAVHPCSSPDPINLNELLYKINIAKDRVEAIEPRRVMEEARRMNNKLPKRLKRTSHCYPAVKG